MSREGSNARFDETIEAARRERLKSLSLTFGKLVEIPEALEEFQWLETLDVSGNHLRCLPAWLSKLPRLRGVVAYGNPLEEVGGDLRLAAHWSVLDRLGISDQRILGVALDWEFLVPPDRLLALSDLRELDLGRWESRRAPPLWLEPLLEKLSDRFPQLESLGLFGCDLARLPDTLGDLAVLKRLDLTANRLTQLPEAFRQLSCLQTIHLLDNPIRELPDWLFDLPDLRDLGLGFCEIQELPEALRRADRLVSLALGDNPLDSVPEWIGSLQRLEYLSLRNLELSEIPRGVFRLPRLRTLSLERVDFGLLTWTRAGREIQRTRSPKNRIDEVPPEILTLTRLRHLDVEGQPIATPPEEVVSRGLDAIRDYWRQRSATGTDYLSEAKLLIVGEGGAGKSTLAAKILDPGYRLDPNRPSTEGIDILRWRFPSQIQPREEGAERIDREFDVGIWDFGGQEIYHTTHQFFLTRRSLYVLVADSRKEDTDFQYWLGVVKLLAGDAPLVIVKNEKQDRRRELDEVGLRARFPNVQEILATNLQTNRGLNELVRRLRFHLESLPHIGDALPASWKQVREVLESDPRDHMPLVEFLEVCGQHGFTEEAHKLQLSAYLHDLGICLHFQDDPVLKHTLILRPSWATEAVYRVLDDDQVVAAYGHFVESDLERIWSSPEHARMEQELLHLMMKFELCYTLPDQAGYIAPQLLPASRPDYEWQAGNDLVLRWVYGFMPKGILTRLAVATHPYIAGAGRTVWRTGVVLEQDDARCEVVEDYPGRQLVLRAQGPGRKVLLGIALHELERIHKSFPKLEVEARVPCNCPSCVGQPDPGAFPLEALRRAARERQRIQCQRSWEMVDAAVLIDAVFEPERRRPGAKRSEFSELSEISEISESWEDPEPSNPPEVFVSYAWRADTSIVDSVTDALRGRGIAVVRDRDELRYKDPIRNFMKRAGQTRAVVLVISEAYLRSPNCMFELVEVEASTSFRERSFPIVLEPEAIHDPLRILGHVKYWEDKIAELDTAMKGVEGSNLEGLRETLDLYREIRASVARLTDILGDMNHLTSAEHSASGFEGLAEAIGRELAPG